jgi:hypothetical protein
VAALLGWAALAFFAYLLSTGPFVMMDAKGNRVHSSLVIAVYTPAGWLYRNTFFRKPIGMYWHLLDPTNINMDGTIKIKPPPAS